MTPKNRSPFTDDDEEKIYSDRQFRAALSRITRTMQSDLVEEVGRKLQLAHPVEKKSSIKEWVAIALSLIMWFASITYMAGVIGQRVTELEESYKLLHEDTMSKEQLQEKFDGISLRLKALEEMQKSLMSSRGAKE